MSLENVVQHPSSRLSAILDGKFFEIIKRNGEGRVEATCVSCFSSGKNSSVNGNLQTTSNFTTHLKRKHPELLKEYEAYKTSEEVKKRKAADAGQRAIDFPVVRKVSAIKSRLEQSVLNFVIDSMSPLQIVDSTAFRQLCKSLNADATIPCSKTVRLKIATEFEKEQQKTMNRLKSADWVCCTADIWSTRTRSFIGVTSHWIKPTFERESAVLSLKRFSGSHTYDRIAELLCEMFEFYEIRDKITAVVTDNGSNFVKAFKEFGLDLEIDCDEDHPLEEGEDVQSIDFSELETEEGGTSLPHHVRCASHTLSLVATKNVTEEPELTHFDPVSRANVKKTMRVALAKCSAFFNKASRSDKVSEEFQKVTGKSIVKPVPTRWNSLYDAITRLIEVRPKLDEVFGFAEVAKLKSTDVEFLEEYLLAMKPIASALDTLQSEKEFYFGLLAPIISTAYKELSGLTPDETPKIYASYIAERLKQGFINRFGYILEKKIPEAEAAILLPWFKLRWMPETDRNRLKTVFINQAKLFSSKCTPAAIEYAEDKTKWSKYLTYHSQPSQAFSGLDGSIELECLTYLQDPDVKLESLKKYPTLLSMFLSTIRPFHLQPLVNDVSVMPK